MTPTLPDEIVDLAILNALQAGRKITIETTPNGVYLGETAHVDGKKVNNPDRFCIRMLFLARQGLIDSVEIDDGFGRTMNSTVEFRLNFLVLPA